MKPTFRLRSLSWTLCRLFWIAWLISACQAAPTPLPPIKIGLITYLEGRYTETSGMPTLQAAQLAVQQVNAAGGISLNGQSHLVELVVAGIVDSPEAAVLAAEKLINQDQISALIGPQFSREAIPAGQIAQDDQIPMISPMSTNPATTAGRDFVFRAGFVDTYQGPALAEFAYSGLKARRAAVLYDASSAYNRMLAETFAGAYIELEGQIVAFESYTNDSNQDFSAVLARIAAAQPEVLFLPNYTVDVLLQGRQARALGIEAVLLGGDGWGASTLSKEAFMQGAFQTQHWHPSLQLNDSQAFVQAFSAAYGRPPNTDAALAYDAARLILTAIQYAGSSDPLAIRQGLYDLPVYHGVSGDIRYEENGDPQKSAVIVQYQNGESRIYDTLSP